MSATLTPDERAWLRERHRPGSWHIPPNHCSTCVQDWPCPTIRCLDALEAAEIELLLVNDIDLYEWTRDIIEGPGGMLAWEEHEIVMHHCSDRVATARWVLRCLANPHLTGSADVLASIQQQRRGGEAGRE